MTKKYSAAELSRIFDEVQGDVLLATCYRGVLWLPSEVRERLEKEDNADKVFRELADFPKYLRESA